MTAHRKKKVVRKKRAKKKKIVRKKRAKKNPRRKSAKSHLWNVFKCHGNSVRFLGITAKGNFTWATTRGHAIGWKLKSEATKVAKYVASKRGMSKYQIGVTDSSTSTASIRSQCKGK